MSKTLKVHQVLTKKDTETDRNRQSLRKWNERKERKVWQGSTHRGSEFTGAFKCHLQRLVFQSWQRRAGVITAQSAQAQAECHCQGPSICYGTNGYVGCMATINNNYSSWLSQLIHHRFFFLLSLPFFLYILQHYFYHLFLFFTDSTFIVFSFYLFIKAIARAFMNLSVRWAKEQRLNIFL